MCRGVCVCVCVCVCASQLTQQQDGYSVVPDVCSTVEAMKNYEIAANTSTKMATHSTVPTEHTVQGEHCY